MELISILKRFIWHFRTVKYFFPAHATAMLQLQKSKKHKLSLWKWRKRGKIKRLQIFTFQSLLISCAGSDLCLPGGCGFLIRWAASYRHSTLSITSLFSPCILNGVIDIFFLGGGASSCKLVRKLHFPSRRLQHGEPRPAITLRPRLAIQ